MAGPLTALLLPGLLAQAPGGFTFEGREASARTEQPDGFFVQGPLPFTDLAESGTGSAELTVVDRVTSSEATYGDKASFSATFRLGATDYRVELSQAGFPPVQALGQAPSWPLPSPPRHTVGGGVLLDVPLYGDSGLGWSVMTRTHAAVAVWGVGSVWRNGQLLTDAAFVHVAALDAGAYADDDTHRMLRQARAGDTELVVLVWNLPPEQEPRGFIQFVFEDVGITVDGTLVRSVAVVENTGNLTVEPRFLTPVPQVLYPAIPAVISPPTVGTGGSGLATDTLTPLGPESLVVPDETPAVVVGSGFVPQGGGTLDTGVGTVVQVPQATPETNGGVPATGTLNPPVNIPGLAPGATLPAEDATVLGQAPQGTITGFGSAASSFISPGGLSTTGSFSVQPLFPLGFDAFTGGATTLPVTPTPLDSDVGTIQTDEPAPLNSAPATALPSSPVPLNSAPATALPATPAPLNSAPATALPTTPAPGNVAPGTGTTTPVGATPAPTGSAVTPSN